MALYIVNSIQTLYTRVNAQIGYHIITLLDQPRPKTSVSGRWCDVLARFWLKLARSVR